MKIIIIIVILALIYFIVKPYFVKYDTVIAYTGGLGSGKTLNAVIMSIRLLKKNRLKVKFRNIKEWIKTRFTKKTYKPTQKPQLITSIPMTYSTWIFGKRQTAIKLTENMLLLREDVPEKSVVFIDEVGAYATQFEYNNPNIRDNFDEFIRLFRHYTKGGYLVVTEQCSENIVLTIRRRLNKVLNLMHFKHFWIVYWVKVRNMSISEEIKTIDQNNTEDNMRTLIGIMPSRKTYDTYCYSERYRTVPKEEKEHYKIGKLKRYDLLKVTTGKHLEKMTTDEEPKET